MTPDHAARIAHEAAQLGDRSGIGHVEIAPRRTLLPGGDRLPDRRLIEPRGAADEVQLDGRS